MPFKIVRNDITKMNTEAIVNTANEEVIVSNGCDSAIYKAAGYEELLQYRAENIGQVSEGEAFITPGFHLQAKYIIHAVSPLYRGGRQGEEKKLRSCYRKSLQLAIAYGIKSIAFPLISTGSFGYPKEEGIRIAADEINAFLLNNEMEIYLVVFGDKSTRLGKKLYPSLEAYIDRNYVSEAEKEEYGVVQSCSNIPEQEGRGNARYRRNYNIERFSVASVPDTKPQASAEDTDDDTAFQMESTVDSSIHIEKSGKASKTAEPCFDFVEMHQDRLDERMKHMSDTYSQYLMYLIHDRHMENSEVYKRAIVDKKIFSKIKNNKNYHPNKLTALCLCVGAMLNLDESRDLLARAGYALSPCDKTDIIFSYFIENEIYDMIELDIQLEEHGLPCIIS